jgi:hypothetical protein
VIGEDASGMRLTLQGTLVVALVSALAGCGGTKTVVRTVTGPMVSPPPAKSTELSGIASGGEEAIKVDRHLSSGVTARVVPRFKPATGCGVVRWAVKTLTDPGASRVDLTPQATTVSALGTIARPVDPTDRVSPTETTVFRLTDVKMTAFTQEADSDIHLALADDAGHTMIAEFPSPSCDTTAAPNLRAKMTKARDDLVAACGQPPRGDFRSLSGTASMTGVGFFDRRHGNPQRGVAPNNIELHPVLSFTAPGCRSR